MLRHERGEIRELADAEIRARIPELEEERFRLRFRGATRAARGSAAAAGAAQGHRAPEHGAEREAPRASASGP